MAKQVGAESPTKESKLIGKADLLKLLKSMRATKGQIAEIRGEIGSKVAKAAADKNYHTAAGSVAAKLDKWLANDDIAKAVAFVQHLDHYIDCLGIREMDMFTAEGGEEEAELPENVGDIRPRSLKRRERERAEGDQPAAS